MVSEIPLDDFLAESEQIIDSLNKDLLSLDQSTKGGSQGKPDPEILNNIFRAAHSLKGISGLFGFVEMTKLSHALENMLDRLRLGKLKLAANVLDLLFESVENLKIIVVSKGEGHESPTFEQLIQRVENIDNQDEPEPHALEQWVSPAVLSVLTEYEEHRLAENIDEGKSIFRLRASFSLNTFDEDLNDLQKIAKQHGEIITTLPCAEESTGEDITFDILVGSEYPHSVLEEAVLGRGIELKTIKDGIHKILAQTIVPDPALEQPDSSLEGEPEQSEANSSALDDLGSIRSISQTVRVDIGRLDNLMNIVGELVLAKNILSQLVERLKSDAGFSEITMEIIKANRTLERKLSELQEGVLEVRMVPISQIFDKLARNIRKLCRDTNKDVGFDTKGGDTELDKLLIEELGDPLMHIIRNSIDHGIETKAERIQNGKPERGLVGLQAFQRGNHVIIEVSDDGAGLDYNKIREKAIELGIIDAQADPRIDELHEILLMPGFSTADQVSEISGRGVGMDVVKSNIAALSGAIDLESDAGFGTKVTITLPITLAIIQALIVESGSETFAIPLNSVQESLAITPDKIQTIEGREVIELRERTLPLLRLDRLFGLEPKARLEDTEDQAEEQAQQMHEADEGREIYVVKVGIAEKRLGIVVDMLHGRQDIVIKSVGRVLKNIKGIAGATELGNQKVILVLDVVDLMDEASSWSYSSPLRPVPQAGMEAQGQQNV